MHWIKKAVFGMCLTLFIFILVSIFAIGGTNIFSVSFLTLGGFILIIFMGAIETNLMFYS